MGAIPTSIDPTSMPHHFPPVPIAAQECADVRNRYISMRWKARSARMSGSELL